MEGSQAVQILLRVADDQLERSDFVVTMGLVVAYPANDALLDALGFEADKIEDLSVVEVSPHTFRIVELVAAHDSVCIYQTIITI